MQLESWLGQEANPRWLSNMLKRKQPYAEKMLDHKEDLQRALRKINEMEQETGLSFAEIRDIEEGKADRDNNVLTNAPHTMQIIGSDAWDRPYSRERAAWPKAWLRDAKFWPTVGRIDNVYGDRNLVCSCPPMSEYETES